MNRKSLVMVIALAAMAGNAAAATDINKSCPDLRNARIVKSKSVEGDTYTTISTSNGNPWIGVNPPEADDVELRELTFTSVSILSDEHLIACDYAGPGLSGLRMSLKLKKVAQPVGASWEQDPNRSNVLICSDKDRKRCAFKL
ncbi:MULTISPECIES: DUF3757 domain-containing protein [Xanthomonas]|uniref:DUF3757 domain-containing protein n=1 Tax=Xanthomonas TaxID=338 RepID=UPI00096D865D|nr:DUF3757 domain-containing protein [Xanthomonas campestris]MCC5094707.1 DUF3757 domain-containing protein [Xanthomonas campestris pv. incanae]MEA9612275.1 DUF3757 domain-containing protein [Xanthomonas campestris pv. incanae]MEA9619964.1 DUF3757 domain-containing protein [Xanthomonas campestris pv. incanae]RFF40079.1 DUF3757 domain-containing protein [Xanthomonas campestris pv. incanae]WDJ09642.1 DUF3757 domain-containing protein [Xanthomonas campestris pv. incanae]